MTLIDSLLLAMVEADGDAVVVDSGWKPYILANGREIAVEAESVSLDEAEASMTELLLPAERRTFDRLNAIHSEPRPLLAALPDELFTLVAVRDGPHLWLEIRRNRKPASREASTLGTFERSRDSDNTSPGDSAAGALAVDSSPSPVDAGIERRKGRDRRNRRPVELRAASFPHVLLRSIERIRLALPAEASGIGGPAAAIKGAQTPRGNDPPAVDESEASPDSTGSLDFDDDLLRVVTANRIDTRPRVDGAPILRLAARRNVPDPDDLTLPGAGDSSSFYALGERAADDLTLPAASEGASRHAAPSPGTEDADDLTLPDPEGGSHAAFRRGMDGADDLELPAVGVGRPRSAALKRNPGQVDDLTLPPVDELFPEVAVDPDGDLEPGDPFGEPAPRILSDGAQKDLTRRKPGHQ